MCGFCGFSGNKVKSDMTINKMMEKIIHRGPDSAGVFLHEKMNFGFRRLSIIGLETGDQPLYNETGNLVMVFNGEIYNYLELREVLESKGHIFKTESDAETLLHLYEEYGTSMLTHLRGMFAFALFDIESSKLFCARDPFGIKPFYYTCVDNEIIFGSEIKSFYGHPSFKPEVNKEALAGYLSFQYSVLTETFFKGVFRLPPGHFMIWEHNEVSINLYASHLFTPVDADFDTAVKQVDAVVSESIKKHMISDVEVGSFLSGGVDSSYVAAKFGGSKTFTVGFDYENYSEIEYAKNLSDAIGTEHISKVISTDEYWESLSTVQYHMDEPLADPAAVALYFVSREAAKHVKVVLSGEGADELFGGYNIYKEPLSLKYYAKLPLPLREWIASIAKRLPKGLKGRGFLMRGAKPVEERFIGGAFIFNEEERAEILNFDVIHSPGDITRPFYAQVKHEDDTTKMQYIDTHLWMPGDILLKADKMSMAHSLEVRVPLLDREVFRVASCLPLKHKVSRKATKIAFRKAAESSIPETTANRRKLGFPVPIRVWLREGKFFNIVQEKFNSKVSEEYFNTEALIKLLNEHYSGKHDNSRKIWTVYMFLLWHDEYFTGE